ncbi:AcrB/AcrD/AcrF family protein [Lacticaseibacillus rhamnosus]
MAMRSIPLYVEMSNYASINLVSQIARLPGVGNVNVFGVGEYAMRIWLDPQKLHAFGLVPEDVVLAIKQVIYEWADELYPESSGCSG